MMQEDAPSGVRLAELVAALSIPDLLSRYAVAGGRFLVCPICFNARCLDQEQLVDNADLGGTVQLWEWIGDDPVTTFSY